MQLREQALQAKGKWVELKSKITTTRDTEQKSVVDAFNKKNNFVVGEEWLKHGIEWQSNSSASLPNFLYGFQYLLYPELKKFLMHSANVKMGQWIGEFLGHIYEGKLSIDDAYNFIEDMAKHYEPNKFANADDEKMKKFLTLVKQYLTELMYQVQQVAGNNKVMFEKEIVLYLKGLNVPITGWLDVAILDKNDKLINWIEIKTKYPMPDGHYKKNTADNKIGDRKWKNPSPVNEPHQYYETQMAIYTQATGMLGHQIICTPNATTLLRPEEHEKLQKPYLDKILKQVYQKLMVRQNLLKLCNDATTFMRLSEPDFNTFKIKDWNPEYKQLLKGVYDY